MKERLKLERAGAAIAGQSETPSGTQTTTSQWNYWPQIDGLRAVAVLSVLAFHLDRARFGAGFIGVDVFFTISGFLICTILIADIDGDGFSLAKFYQRRIARIAPAQFLVIAATMAGAALLYSAQDFASVGANAAAAALAAVNLNLLFHDAYFQAATDTRPLLHYWSLGVEEQFYLVFPLFLFAVVRFTRRPIAVVWVVAAASYATCVAITPSQPVWAFYLLPTRAWELLAGAAFALTRRDGGGLSPARADLAVWAGLALIVLSWLAISDGPGFPGWIAALPVAATALVLAAIDGAKGPIVWLLRHPVAVGIGKRSYSLYLWHWPIFSFVDYSLFAHSGAMRLALKLALTALAAAVTYQWFERPLRTWLNRLDRRAIAFGGLAVAAVTTAALGLHVRASQYLNVDPNRISGGGVTINPRGRGSVVLLGDSQGSMYAREFAGIARKAGSRLSIICVDGRNVLASEPSTLWPSVKNYLTARRPDVIIVTEEWSKKLGSNPLGLRAAIAALAPLAGRVILITEPPQAPPGATHAAIEAGGSPTVFETPADRRQRLASTAAVEALAGGKIAVVDPAPAMLTGSGSLKLIAANGRLTYEDPRHLTDTGTALVRPLFEQALTHAPITPHEGSP